jgi:hypothetical protein
MALAISALILASLAFILALIAASNSYQTLRLLRSHSVKSVLELSVQQAAQASALESLSITMKRLSSRYGMAEKRGAGGRAESSELKGSDWKKQARLQFIKPGVPVNHLG